MMNDDLEELADTLDDFADAFDELMTALASIDSPDDPGGTAPIILN